MTTQLRLTLHSAHGFSELAARNAELFADWYGQISAQWQAVPPEMRDRIAGWRVSIGGTEVHVVQCALSEAAAAELASNPEAGRWVLPSVVEFLERQPVPDGFEVVHMYPSRRMIEELEL